VHDSHKEISIQSSYSELSCFTCLKRAEGEKRGTNMKFMKEKRDKSHPRLLPRNTTDNIDVYITSLYAKHSYTNAYKYIFKLKCN
jgi:hypothetical protein